MSYEQGTTASLVGLFYTHEGGPLVDLDATPTITITPAAGGAAVIGPTTTGVAHPATGTYTYSWAVGAAQATGDYIVTWSGLAGAEATAAVELVTVIAPDSVSGGAWATVSDVLAATGVTVTTATLALAQSVVELYANRTYAASDGVTTRDLHWLRMAVCYQAAWQPSQPGYMTATRGVKTYAQDGMSVSHASVAEITLAPLALRALRNLTWWGTRSIAGKSGRPPATDFLNEASDVFHGWTPLPEATP